MRSGAQALRFSGRASGPYVYQDVAAVGGIPLVASGWLNVSQRTGDHRVMVELIARHANGGTLQTFQLASATVVTGGWTGFSSTVVPPAGTASARLQIRFPRLSGVTYVDELSISRSRRQAPRRR